MKFHTMRFYLEIPDTKNDLKNFIRAIKNIGMQYDIILDDKTIVYDNMIKEFILCNDSILPMIPIAHINHVQALINKDKAIIENRMHNLNDMLKVIMNTIYDKLGRTDITCTTNVHSNIIFITLNTTVQDISIIEKTSLWKNKVITINIEDQYSISSLFNKGLEQYVLCISLKDELYAQFIYQYIDI